MVLLLPVGQFIFAIWNVAGKRCAEEGWPRPFIVSGVYHLRHSAPILFVYALTAM